MSCSFRLSFLLNPHVYIYARTRGSRFPMDPISLGNTRSFLRESDRIIIASVQIYAKVRIAPYSVLWRFEVQIYPQGSAGGTIILLTSARCRSILRSSRATLFEPCGVSVEFKFCITIYIHRALTVQVGYSTSGAVELETNAEDLVNFKDQCCRDSRSHWVEDIHSSPNWWFRWLEGGTG